MAQQEWMDQLKELAARRAGGEQLGGAEGGAPPFTWKLEVKGQGMEGMPMMPGGRGSTKSQSPKRGFKKRKGGKKRR